MSLLDVGCGPGTITMDLASRVAPGAVIGMDCSEDALAAARELSGDLPELSFCAGDVYAMEFDDSAFDVVHAHQVLQHLDDPVGALVEMRRVCRPGGMVAVRDGDYATMAWYPDSPELVGWLDLYCRAARANGGEPDAGRRLISWAQAAGFTDVTASASSWCFSTAEDRRWWAETWAERITVSALAKRIVELGLADRGTLDAIGAGWLRWAEAADGWFAMIHGEVLCRPE
jgi:ubiquinone/menaquinone biosynthesis C-methylase UbiE